ncbi:MAG: phosphate ABC transporter permease subunit PstC [Chloroflexi bacterium]|nr:phosphate ABC transporter permease subunit PstC [Chloroflexota bacterium]
MASQQGTLASHYPPRTTLARNRARDARERGIQGVLLLAAAVGVLTTFGILVALTADTIKFFRDVSIVDFLTQTEWTPLFSIKRFGIWPLIVATGLTSAIALAIAVPLGLMSAIYLSEFAAPAVRDILKPALEVLAGVPTVVYGFFALIFVTPILQNILPGVSTFNSLSAGLVMGIMITPLVASLSEDAMASVPRALREGAYGLGSTRFEVATRVVFPAALSGIVAAVILALSRAVGETMIVAIAAGQNPTLTVDPRVPVETMTAYIVQVSLGDTPYGSLSYLTIFAVGSTLFVLTFILNIFSHWFVGRFREVYD